MDVSVHRRALGWSSSSPSSLLLPCLRATTARTRSATTAFTECELAAAWVLYSAGGSASRLPCGCLWLHDEALGRVQLVVSQLWRCLGHAEFC